MVTSSRKIQRPQPIQADESQFWAIFNCSPAAMAICRQADLRFRAVNQAWLDCTGYTCEEAIGRTAEELGLMDGHLSWRESHHQACPDKGLTEIAYRARSGEERTGLWRMAVIESAGEPCVLTAFIDTTEREKLEQELTRLSRLNLVGEMAASLGHEVRTPITTVRGFLQLLRRKKQYAVDYEIIDIMLAEIDRANSMITEFLSLAKNKSSALRPGNIGGVLSVLTPLLQADILRRGHQVIIEPCEVPDILMCDKEIQQLILNLACNAFEAMTTPGTVTIKTSAADGAVLLTVRDTGPGISPHIMDDIGTPFLTTKPQGNGLGLSICYRIVQRHNASMTVDSTPAGVTFTVRFRPAHPESYDSLADRGK